MKALVGEWDTKTVVGVALGAILFAINMVYIQVPIFTQVQLSLAPVVIVIVGALYGPLPAALAAGFGNILADMIGGWGFWFDWTIGWLIVGFLFGLLPIYGVKIKEGIMNKRQIFIFIAISIIAPLLSYIGVVPFFTKMWYQGELEIGMIQGFIAAVQNTVVVIIVGIPVLNIMAKRYKLKTDLSEEL